VSIDVIVEVNQSIIQHDNRGIDDQDWNRVREIHLLRRAAFHGSANTFRGPARIVAQDPRSQIVGPLQPDTTMAEIPSGLREEGYGWSVVHVHTIAVWKDKFHKSKGVLWARLLLDKKFSCSELAEQFIRNRPGRYDVLPAVHNLESIFRQVIRIVNKVRNYLISGNGIWHLTIWAENDVLHGVAKHGGVMVIRFANHDLHHHTDI